MVSKRRIAANAVAGTMGVIYAFLMIGPLLFADPGFLSERLLSFAVVLIIYFITASGISLIDRGSKAYVPLFVPAPVTSFSIFTIEGVNGTFFLLVHLMYPLIAFAGSFIPFFLFGLVEMKFSQNRK